MKKILVIVLSAALLSLCVFGGYSTVYAEESEPPVGTETTDPDIGGELTEEDLSAMTPEQIYAYLQEIRSQLGELVSINEEQQSYWLDRLLKEETMPLLLRIAIETVMIGLFVILAFSFFKKRIAKFIEQKNKGVDDVTAKAEAQRAASEESQKNFEAAMANIEKALSKMDEFKSAYGEQIKAAEESIKDIAKNDKALIASGVSEKIIGRLSDE